jgi:hypothetical protein
MLGPPWTLLSVDYSGQPLEIRADEQQPLMSVLQTRTEQKALWLLLLRTQGPTHLGLRQ